MTIEQRLDILEKDVKYLRDTLTQAMANMTPVISKADNSANKVDDTSNKVDALTPAIITKKVSIGDTEVTFNNVPNGNITVFVEDEDGNYPNYTMERNSNIITVYFEPSEYVTTVTLSIV